MIVKIQEITVSKTFCAETLKLENYTISGVFLSDVRITSEHEVDNVRIIPVDTDLKPYVYRFIISLFDYHLQLRYVDLMATGILDKINRITSLLTDIVASYLVNSSENKDSYDNKVIKPL